MEKLRDIIIPSVSQSVGNGTVFSRSDYNIRSPVLWIATAGKPVIPSLIFGPPKDVDDYAGGSVPSNVSLIFALVHGVGNSERLRSDGYVLDLRSIIDQAFYGRRNFGIVALFDIYRVSSRGMASYEVEITTPVYRTIHGFMTDMCYYENISRLVRSRGVDHDNCKNLIGMYFANYSDNHIRERLVKELAGCSYHQFPRPSSPNQTVFGHLDIPVLSKLLSISVTVYTAPTYGSLELDYVYQCSGPQNLGTVFLLYVPSMHRYSLLGFKSLAQGCAVSVQVVKSDDGVGAGVLAVAPIDLSGGGLDVFQVFNGFGEDSMVRQGGFLLGYKSVGKPFFVKVPHPTTFERSLLDASRPLSEIEGSILKNSSIMVGFSNENLPGAVIETLYFRPSCQYHVNNAYWHVNAFTSLDTQYYCYTRVDEMGDQVRYVCTQPGCESWIESSSSDFAVSVTCSHGPSFNLIGSLDSDVVPDIFRVLNGYSKELCEFQANYSSPVTCTRLSRIHPKYYVPSQNVTMSSLQQFFFTGFVDPDFPVFGVKVVSRSIQVNTCARQHKLLPITDALGYEFRKSDFVAFCSRMVYNLRRPVLYNYDLLLEMHGLAVAKSNRYIHVTGVAGSGKTFLLQLLAGLLSLSVITDFVTMFSILSNSDQRVYLFDCPGFTLKSASSYKLLARVPVGSVIFFTSVGLGQPWGDAYTDLNVIRLNVQSKSGFLYNSCKAKNRLFRILLRPSLLFLNSRKLSWVCFRRDRNCWLCHSRRQIESLRKALTRVVCRLTACGNLDKRVTSADFRGAN